MLALDKQIIYSLTTDLRRGASVDRKEAIHLFIKKNSSIFNRKPFPKQVFKKLKRSFFADQVKCPVPKDSEIAGEIIEGMILSLQIKNKAELDSIFSFPFFSSRLHNKQYYYERLELKASQTTPLVDVKSLEKADAAEKFRKELKEEVKEEFLDEKKAEVDEWDQKISQKAEEYYSFPSILDQEEYPIPDVSEEKKSTDVYVPWWVKLGLNEDPFRELVGLPRLSQSLLEKIVHKTEIFLKYEIIAENSPTELFRNTIVMGQFGSGKTTFFDYMNSRLNNYGILPVYIQLGGEFEVRELIFDFRKKVSIELRRLYPIFVGANLPFPESLDDEQMIIDLMKKLSYKGAKGFVIFIDDLHKGDLQKAMRFLSYLQVLTSQMRRGTDLNIGFFIAGDIAWEVEISNSPKFSGSVDKQEIMPPLQMDVALDAINRRLAAYAKNPENPRQLEKTFIERIYKKLQYDMKDITFRKVMREVLNEFEAGHFDALSADPIDIEKKTLDAIRNEVERNPRVLRQLNRIILGSDMTTAEQKRKCLQLLIRVYLYKGLPESEIREPDVPFLQRLDKAGLIVKVLDNVLTWKISKELFELNRNIINEYGLSIEDYLVKLFQDQIPQKSVSLKSRNDEFVKLEELLTFVNRDLGMHFLTDAKYLHRKILESTEKYLSFEEKPHIIIENCVKSLAKITKAYMFYENIETIPESNALNTLSFWRDFWWSSEAIMQFVRAATSNIENKRKIPIVLNLYREAFHHILYFFSSELENSKLFRIPLMNLKNDEIKLLHECRQFWRENNYNGVADILVKTVERKIRELIYNVFTVLYGDYENRMKWIDKESRRYIEQNIHKDMSKSFPISLNEFQNLNRSQYKNLMTGIDGSSMGRRNWKHIFSTIFLRWTERDLYNYLSMFAEINIKISHLKDEPFAPSEQDYVYDFMQKSTRFMMSTNRVYGELIGSKFFKCDSETASFSLCYFKYDDNTVPIIITDENKKRIIETFKDKTIVRLSLDDQEYVEGFFGLKYRLVFALLARLHQGMENPADNLKYTLQIMRLKASEIRMALSKIISSTV